MAAKTKKETAAVAETKETAKKAMWKKEMKRKISELVDLKVYVKPEEGKAHYVINGEITGSIEL